MTDHARDRAVASLSGSLLARKGAANASGFATAPDAVPPLPAEISLPHAGSHESGIGDRHSPARDDARTQRRILLVEDNPLNMKMMTDLFEVHGYRALHAANGYEAMAMAHAKRPDLIVMDIKLPGLSGLDVISRLKRDGDLMAIPVIAVSALARAEEEVTIRNAGFDEFLSKPFSVRSILLTVARFLH